MATASSSDAARGDASVPAATALSDGLLTLLTPLVDKCDTGIQQALDNILKQGQFPACCPMCRVETMEVSPRLDML